MSKVLLIDTNFSSAPIYDYLVECNHDVFVCGGNPRDFLARICPNYINQDYVDISAMRKLVNSLAFDFIIPGCNDVSYRICAELNVNSQYVGIDDVAATDIINNKHKYRDFAKRNGINVPKVISSSEIGSIWPIIIKPVDAYSGRGMTVLHESDFRNLSGGIALAESFSKTQQCIIEEYVTGQLYSHSAFIVDHQILIDFIVEEHCTVNPFVVDTSRVIHDISPSILGLLRKYTIQTASVMGLCDGLVHTQFIAREDMLWIIEVTRRCPGDLYSYLIQASTGFRYAEAYTKSFIGCTTFKNNWQNSHTHLMRHTISQSEERSFDSLHFHFPFEMNRMVPLSPSGALVKASPFDRIGIIFIKASSEDELMDIFNATLNRALYSIVS